MDYGSLGHVGHHQSTSISLASEMCQVVCDYQKSLCFWTPWLPLLLCVTTAIQLYFSSDLPWSVIADEFQGIEEIC